MSALGTTARSVPPDLSGTRPHRSSDGCRIYPALVAKGLRRDGMHIFFEEWSPSRRKKTE